MDLVDINDILKAFNQTMKPSDDYWRSIFRLTLRGRLDDVIELLRLIEGYTSHDLICLIMVNKIEKSS
jgi:hypothetical protein